MKKVIAYLAILGLFAAVQPTVYAAGGCCPVSGKSAKSEETKVEKTEKKAEGTCTIGEKKAECTDKKECTDEKKSESKG